MLNNFDMYYAFIAVSFLPPSFFILKNFKLIEKLKEYFDPFGKLYFISPVFFFFSFM